MASLWLGGRCLCLQNFPSNEMDIELEQDLTEHTLEGEALKPGQTRLHEYFQARFKGAQLQSKASTAAKIAALPSHSHKHAVVGGAGATWEEISPSSTYCSGNKVPPSQPAGLSLSERIERARALVEPALEDVCCLKVPTHRRSVGITCCRALSPNSPNAAEAGHLNSQIVSLATPAHASRDWTQLNVAGAAEIVEEAARLFSRVSSVFVV